MTSILRYSCAHMVKFKAGVDKKVLAWLRKKHPRVAEDEELVENNAETIETAYAARNVAGKSEGLMQPVVDKIPESVLGERPRTFSSEVRHGASRPKKKRRSETKSNLSKFTETIQARVAGPAPTSPHTPNLEDAAEAFAENLVIGTVGGGAGRAITGGGGGAKKVVDDFTGRGSTSSSSSGGGSAPYKPTGGGAKTPPFKFSAPPEGFGRSGGAGKPPPDLPSKTPSFSARGRAGGRGRGRGRRPAIPKPQGATGKPKPAVSNRKQKATVTAAAKKQQIRIDKAARAAEVALPPSDSDTSASDTDTDMNVDNGIQLIQQSTGNAPIDPKKPVVLTSFGSGGQATTTDAPPTARMDHDKRPTVFDGRGRSGSEPVDPKHDPFRRPQPMDPTADEPQRSAGQTFVHRVGQGVQRGARAINDLAGTNAVQAGVATVVAAIAAGAGALIYEGITSKKTKAGAPKAPQFKPVKPKTAVGGSATDAPIDPKTGKPKKLTKAQQKKEDQKRGTLLPSGKYSYDVVKDKRRKIMADEEGEKFQSYRSPTTPTLSMESGSPFGSFDTIPNQPASAVSAPITSDDDDAIATTSWDTPASKLKQINMEKDPFASDYQGPGQEEQKGDKAATHGSDGPDYHQGEATMRSRYGVVGSDRVIPSGRKQLQSDLLFDMFSIVQPGFGEGRDNKLFNYQEFTQNDLQASGPRYWPRPSMGPSNTQYPMPWQWQPVMDPRKAMAMLVEDAHKAKQVQQLINQTGEASVGALGYDRPEHTSSHSSSELPRDARSYFEPVIQNSDEFHPIHTPAGYRLKNRGWRRTFSAWREPQIAEHQTMNGGPHLNKRRSLEVILH
jgi:hypothetical protein